MEAGFSALVQTVPGVHPVSCTMGTGTLSGIKRPGLGFVHPPPSRVEVKETVKLYLYSPSGPTWPVTFTFTSFVKNSEHSGIDQFSLTHPTGMR